LLNKRLSPPIDFDTPDTEDADLASNFHEGESSH
jgi:hypothetical protein